MDRRDWLAATSLALLTPRSLDSTPRGPEGASPNTMDPWLEIDSAALVQNVATISRLTGGRRIIAMVKNNAYGLGLGVAGPVLDKVPTVWGFGVVRADEARTLRTASVSKPIVLMGPAPEEEREDLVRRGIRLTANLDSDGAWLIGLARKLARPVPVHLYVDTGMHRMGIPHEAVLPWLESPGLRQAITIEGIASELTEDAEFDRDQAGRLSAIVTTARGKGIELGPRHAASSDAVMLPNPETFLDLVRPGLALYGGYPTRDSMVHGELRPTYRLKARVIRVDRLEPGDGVSYHRRFKADRPIWTATLAIGHVDGYPAGAVRGCEVLIGDRLHPVVGTVSASHTMVSLGDEPVAQVGDEAVLVGPDRPSLHPNMVAERAGWSEYNMFMHLHPGLGRRLH